MFFLPLLAVIYALPAFLARIMPLEETVTIPLLEDFHLKRSAFTFFFPEYTGISFLLPVFITTLEALNE